MSQHLIDTGERISPGPAGTAASELRGVGGNGNGSAHGPGRTGDEPAEGAAHGPEGGAHGAEGGAHGAEGGDPTLHALEALSAALSEMGRDQQLLERRLRALHRERSAGRPWREILADEEPPGTMQIVSRMLACLAKASGTLRKDLVDALRREGVSIPAIAKLFGVTHQRVSNLLRRPSG